MATFDKKDFQRFAVSTIGAIALSSACVLAAVGPAHGASPAPLTVSDWQTNVEKQIDARMQNTATLPNWDAGDAVVSVHFNADGAYAGATLAQSSGIGLYDSHAMNVAKRIAYPALPAGVRGAPQDVEMRLSYGEPKLPLRNARQPQLAAAEMVGAFRMAAK